MFQEAFGQAPLEGVGGKPHGSQDPCDSWIWPPNSLHLSASSFSAAPIRSQKSRLPDLVAFSSISSACLRAGMQENTTPSGLWIPHHHPAVDGWLTLCPASHHLYGLAGTSRSWKWIFVPGGNRPHHSFLRMTGGVWIKKVNKRDCILPSMHLSVSTESVRSSRLKARAVSARSFCCGATCFG